MKLVQFHEVFIILADELLDLLYLSSYLTKYSHQHNITPGVNIQAHLKHFGYQYKTVLYSTKRPVDMTLQKSKESDAASRLPFINKICFSRFDTLM